MDEGDRPASDDDSGDRTDPDDEGIDPDDEGIDPDDEGANSRNPDAESDQNPDAESARNIGSTPSDWSNSSESAESDSADASGETGEAEKTVPDWDSGTGDNSSATSSEAREAGVEETEETEVEKRDVHTAERDRSSENHYPDDRSPPPGDGTRPPNNPKSASNSPNSDDRKSLAHRFRHDNDGALMWIREMLSSVAIVLVLGLLLFGLSGVWPPMVAVESPSMEPNMNTGDLVFVTEPGRFAPDEANNDIGVVTYEEGVATDYQTFGSYGSVVIFQPPGRTASPIIHRAMFHVEEGENWYERADSQYHSANDCDELRHCPAPHSGFITLGDNNGRYDQASGLAEPVQAEWVTGVARLRVPYLGYVRLIATGQANLGDVLTTTGGVQLSDGNAMVSGGTSGYISSGASSYDSGGTSDYEAVF